MTQTSATATPTIGASQVQAITPCLAFKENAAEAITFYVSLFPNSRINQMARSDGSGPVPDGAVMSASFELDGRPYVGFDGGATFAFSEGMSLMVTCDGQEEIDRLWDSLTADGGEPGPCGWLKDRFGMSWQVIPADLGRMLSDRDGGDCEAAMKAMFSMSKLDVGALRAAYNAAA
jgi:predicted 3-demethylubiquinone-9 3-methyltransferase (glyoxalase superfamily)